MEAENSHFLCNEDGRIIIIEKFLNENNYKFIMADDVPFTD